MNNLLAGDAKAAGNFLRCAVISAAVELPVEREEFANLLQPERRLGLSKPSQNLLNLAADILRLVSFHGETLHGLFLLLATQELDEFVQSLTLFDIQFRGTPRLGREPHGRILQCVVMRGC